MYGSAAFDVRSELKQSRHLLRKVVFSSLGILVFFFLFKQLIGIPFNYLNQFVQAVMVFVTGILAVCTKFFDEIKQMFFK